MSRCWMCTAQEPVHSADGWLVLERELMAPIEFCGYEHLALFAYRTAVYDPDAQLPVRAVQGDEGGAP